MYYKKNPDFQDEDKVRKDFEFRPKTADAFQPPGPQIIGSGRPKTAPKGYNGTVINNMSSTKATSTQVTTTTREVVTTVQSMTTQSFHEEEIGGVSIVKANLEVHQQTSSSEVQLQSFRKLEDIRAAQEYDHATLEGMTSEVER